MKRILIVDDNTEFLQTLSTVLSGDFDTIKAKGVKEALDILQEITVDAVCSDFNMEDGTGLDLLEIIRQQGLKTPFLLMSGDDSRALEQKTKLYYADFCCKKVLKNEARAYLRNVKRQRDRETMFSDLPQHELDKLCTVDRYPSDSFVFSSHGYDLHIDNELVADAFANLPQQEQSILILYCVLDMADGEIASLTGMSRSAVQRHRTKTLKELRVKLMALMPEGG